MFNPMPLIYEEKHKDNLEVYDEESSGYHGQ